MVVHICSDTHPGLVRRNNEDSVVFDADTGLCVLADGMGGHNAGEIASGMATAFLKSELRNRILQAGAGAKTGELETALSDCIAQANHAIFNISRGNPHYAGMGTTLVAGIFHEKSLVLAHLGDSRCYRLRNGELRQITRDHSVQQEQADSGFVPDSAESPFLNAVTRALGTSETVEPEIHCHDIASHDLYLMCSDGLSDMVDEDVIASILMGDATIEAKAAKLVAAANDAGGRDNISVLLALAGDMAARPGLFSAMERALRGTFGGRSK